eukprot:sb/3462613/
MLYTCIVHSCIAVLLVLSVLLSHPNKPNYLSQPIMSSDTSYSFPEPVSVLTVAHPIPLYLVFAVIVLVVFAAVLFSLYWHLKCCSRKCSSADEEKLVGEKGVQTEESGGETGESQEEEGRSGSEDEIIEEVVIEGKCKATPPSSDSGKKRKRPFSISEKRDLSKDEKKGKQKISAKVIQTESPPKYEKDDPGNKNSPPSAPLEQEIVPAPVIEISPAEKEGESDEENASEEEAGDLSIPPICHMVLTRYIQRYNGTKSNKLGPATEENEQEKDGERSEEGRTGSEGRKRRGKTRRKERAEEIKDNISSSGYSELDNNRYPKLRRQARLLRNSRKQDRLSDRKLKDKSFGDETYNVNCKSPNLTETKRKSSESEDALMDSSDANTSFTLSSSENSSDSDLIKSSTETSVSTSFSDTSVPVREGTVETMIVEKIDPVKSEYDTKSTSSSYSSLRSVWESPQGSIASCHNVGTESSIVQFKMAKSDSSGLRKYGYSRIRQADSGGYVNGTGPRVEFSAISSTRDGWKAPNSDSEGYTKVVKPRENGHSAERAENIASTTEGDKIVSSRLLKSEKPDSETVHQTPVDPVLAINSSKPTPKISKQPSPKVRRRSPRKHLNSLYVDWSNASVTEPTPSPRSTLHIDWTDSITEPRKPYLSKRHYPSRLKEVVNNLWTDESAIGICYRPFYKGGECIINHISSSR